MVTQQTPNPGTGDGQQPTGETPDGAQQGEQSAEDIEGLKRALVAERQRARQFEREAKELQTWRQQQEESSKTEAQKTAELAERTNRERAALELERKEFAVRREINKVANDARGIPLADEDAAYRLLDPSDIEFDANGRPTNIAQVLKELVKDRPFLGGSKKPGSVDGGAGVTQVAGMTLDDRIRKIAGFG